MSEKYINKGNKDEGCKKYILKSFLGFELIRALYIHLKVCKRKPYVIVHMIQPYLHKSNYIHSMQNTFYCLITKSHLYFICLLNFVKIGEWKLVSDVSFMRRLIFDWAIPVVWAQVHRLNSFRIIESMFERLRFCTIIHYIWSHIFTCKTIK